MVTQITLNWDASRRIASMGQCEVQIQADGGRAERIHWKSCLIPRMHGFELVCFRCGIPAVVVSFLLIDCLVDKLATCCNSTSGCKLSFVSDVAHECAVCRTFRGWHATRRVASIGQCEVQIQADGGCAAWRAETMQIVSDFSAADGFCRDAHIDIRRESQRQTRPRRRSKLHVAAQTLN